MMGFMSVLMAVILVSAFRLTNGEEEIQVNHLITEDVKHYTKAQYLGHNWQARYNEENVKVFNTIGLNFVGVKAPFDCLKSFDHNDCGLDSGDKLGVEFWMRYKGFNSSILGDVTEYHENVNSLLTQHTPENHKWIKCFDSNEFSWNMKAFRNKCNEKTPTLFLFRVRDDNIFGAFTSTASSWKGSSGFRFSDQGFLFTIANYDKISAQTKFPLTNKEKAVYISDSVLGFGDFDFEMKDGYARSSLGSSYEASTLTVEQKQNILGGSKAFGLTQMEAFYMECFDAISLAERNVVTSSKTSNVQGYPIGSQYGFNPGTYVEVNFDAKYLINGFVVKSSSCSSFKLIYTNEANQKQTYQENSTERVFAPPESVVTQFVLRTSIATNLVRFAFTEEESSCRLRMRFHGCHIGCDGPLGMESTVIRNPWLISNDEKDNSHKANCARINSNLCGGDGCWKPKKDGDYIQVAFSSQRRIITQIGIQCCHNKEDEFPSSIKITYSDGSDFKPYTGLDFNQKTLQTNHHKGLGQQITKLALNPPIIAEKIRIYPHDKAGMRFELYGCIYQKNPKGDGIVLTTGDPLRNRTGIMMSVEKNAMGQNFLKATVQTTTTKYEVVNTQQLNYAEWTRVTFSRPFDGNGGLLDANNASDTKPISRTSVSFPKFWSPIVVLEDPLFNTDNVQLSDILFFTSKASVNYVQGKITGIMDGFHTNFTDYNSKGTDRLPWVTSDPGGFQAQSGCTPSKNTGPCDDHSRTGSPYLYFESSGTDTSTLSSHYRVSAYKCFRFKYFMMGEHMGILTVYVQDSLGYKTLVWRLAGEQGNDWKTAKIPLRQKRPFKILFEAKKYSYAYTSDIAIDKLKFNTLGCQFQPLHASVSYVTGFGRSKIIAYKEDFRNDLMLELSNAGTEKRYWQSCYHSSTDAQADFWKNCENKGPTVTIVRYQDYIFAAFSDRDWGDQVYNNSFASARAFIFSFSNPSKQKNVFRVNSLFRHQAIKVDKSKGPAWGSALEIDGLDVKSSLGKEYGTASSELYLTGLREFEAVEVEVMYQADHTCPEWCSTGDWKCLHYTGKCECLRDRLYATCDIGLSQTLLGTINKQDHPDSYWNLDSYATIYDLKTGKSSVLDSSVQSISPGVTLKALRFTGSTNVHLGDYTDTCLKPSSLTTMSISFWLKYSNKTGNGSQTFFTFGQTDSGAHLKVLQNDTFKEELKVITNFGQKKKTTVFSCPWNVWSYIVITLDGTTADPIVKVYRNAVLLTVTTVDDCEACALASKSAQVYVGDKDPTLCPNADIDEIAMWCKAITQQEIQNIFNFYKGHPDYVVYFKLKFNGQSWGGYETTAFENIQTSINQTITSKLSSPPTRAIKWFSCDGTSNQITCDVTFLTRITNADFLRAFQGNGFPAYVNILEFIATPVPTQWPTLTGYNKSKSEIVVNWNIPEGQPFSIFQKYELTWSDPTDASSSITLAEERYVTTKTISNLKPYTLYKFSLKLWYLGNVSISAENSVRTGEKEPGPVQDLKFITSDGSCITISWKEPAAPIAGLIRYYNITYTPYSGVETPTSITVNAIKNVKFYTHRICNLKDLTKYKLGVAACTVSLGNFTMVDGKTAAKGPSVAPGNVLSLNGTAPHDVTTTCTVKWSPPPVDTLNGNLTSHRITTIDLTNNKTTYVEVGACNNSAIIKRLLPYRKHSITVTATTAQGASPSSTPVYCFTEERVPSAPPTALSSLGTSSTTCNVTWGPVPLEFRNGFIRGYNVSYKSSEMANAKTFVVHGSSVHSTMISGLKMFTNYTIDVTAFTKMGSNNSAVVSTRCQTLEGVPDDVPKNFRVHLKTKLSCTVNWTSLDPTKANGIFRGYSVNVYDTNSTNQSSVGKYYAACPTVTVQGLQPFRLYNISVKGFNSLAFSNASYFQCMTEEDVPLAFPPNLTCTAESSTKIKLCWSKIPILLRRGIVRKRKLIFRNMNNTIPWSKETTSEHCTESVNLPEYSLFSIKIAAFTIDWGNYSETPVQCMTLEGVPKTAPVDITGNNITAYTIWVRWGNLTVQPPGILRQWVIYYRVWNASEDTTRNKTVPLATHRIEIEDLELFTLYCVQVAGFTVGPGVKSSCTYISTDSKWLPPPDGIPSFVRERRDSTPRECFLEWAKTNNSNPDPDGRVTGYTIYYSPQGTNTTQEVKVMGENSTTFNLTILEEFTKYYIAVAAFNIYGVGNKSDEMTCFTKEDVPSQAPVNVTGFNSSSTSIVIKWEDIPKNDKNGIIREYRIIIYEVELGNSSAQVLTYVPKNRARRAISIDPHDQSITGLKKFTKYAIQIYGVTVGNGPLSPIIIVTTAEDVPTAPPANLTVKNASSTSLLLSWNNVPEAYHHGIMRYFVCYYWLADWPIVELMNVTVPIDLVRTNQNGSYPEFQFEVKGLKIWTNYTVKVAGFTIGVGQATEEKTVSTDEDRPCQPPRTVSFDVPIYTQLTVLWTDVARPCRNGIIRGYRLIYRELPNSPPVTINFTTSERNYTLKNMNMEANYTIRVLAFTRIGDGNASFDFAPLDLKGPRSRPINVLAYNFTSTTSVKVTWGPIPDPVILEKVMGYRVYWRVLSIGDTEMEETPWQYFTVRKDANEALIENLENYVHYEVHVSGFTRGGKGPSGISSGKTCRCNRRISTNYRIFPPYNDVELSKDLTKVNMSGMIPQLLNNLVMECCGTCEAHGMSYVDFVFNGQKQPAYQHNENDVVERIDDSNDLSFPVYGWKWQDTYAERYRYIPLVESPGFAFLLRKPDTDSPLKAVLKSIFETWPYLLIVNLMALIAGIIIWFLDTGNNPEEFPQSYIRGAVCGWWWAFISMTTLGYGDKVPKGNAAKTFAVVWVLTGLVVYGILSGSICNAFTSIIYKAKTELYGSSVAAIYDSPEYRFAVRRGAKVSTEKNYSNFNEVLGALQSGEVTGMLMDVYEAGTKTKQFQQSSIKIHIQKIFDFSSTYGVVLAGPSTKLYQCSQSWMSSHRAEIVEHISKYMQVVETDGMDEVVELSTGLFDVDSQVFKDFLKYSLMIYGGCFVLGIFYEIIYQLRKRKFEKLKASSQSCQQKERITRELTAFTNDFLLELQSKITSLREKHTNVLKSVARRRRKDSNSHSWDVFMNHQKDKISSIYT